MTDVVRELEDRLCRDVAIDTQRDHTSATSPSTQCQFDLLHLLADGSRLTEQGVPTPNIFTGMAMIHGPLEWGSLQDMAAAVEVCLHLAQMTAVGGRQRGGRENRS